MHRGLTPGRVKQGRVSQTSLAASTSSNGQTWPQFPCAMQGGVDVSWGRCWLCMQDPGRGKVGNIRRRVAGACNGGFASSLR
jgi:hypothetical protein